ncbi:hypothetical protein O181_040127 [Austropuccinia psidii MF-1]|uniref:Peptidase S8/S53 domain-containing protein n=1 Tax=Austropuccinia psidii MF-1 TaxID=1389203 RepID=A0A9Q3HDK1_9BASI|nr:hypothetical protein [Austropuccinia psidii MF-1]
MFGSKKCTTLGLVAQFATLFMHSTSSHALPVGPSGRETLKHQIRSKNIEVGPERFSVASNFLQRPLTILSPDVNKEVGETLNRLTPYIIILKNEVPVTAYIAKLRDHLDSSKDRLLVEIKIGYVYLDEIIHGFSAQLSREAFDYVIQSSEVTEIIDDSIMTILPYEISILEGSLYQKIFSDSSENSDSEAQSQSNVMVQKGTAPWNLQRISQQNKLNYVGINPNAITYNYSYENPDGQDVFVYVLDTGARVTHSDFEGRVEMAAQFGGYELYDGNGHGTHCTGIIAGKRWGVAKEATIRAVKVLSDRGSGASSDIIAGIQYVLESYRASEYAPTVASLSLGGGKNAAIDRAVEAAINHGIHFAVAAGNSNVDACLSSPASSRGANVVAASDISDSRALYSNWGSCVTLFAPGSNVTSTWASSDNALARLSGTSMAAPHVAGLMAYHLSQRNLTTTQMTNLLRNEANKNAIKLGSGQDAATPNFLIYNGI